MGKGDVKTKKGKRFRSSHGNSRPKLRKKKSTKRTKRLYRIKYLNNKDTKDDNAANQLVFPIMSINEDGYYFIGSGFFINQNGWFITAKHNFFDNKGNQTKPLFVAHVLNGTEVVQRDIIDFFVHPETDIIVGQLRPIALDGKKVDNPVLMLKDSEIKSGEKIFTYAYRKHKIEEVDGRFQMAEFSPKYYDGEYVSTEYRDDSRWNGKGDCIHATINLKGGLSGGPVFDENGYVLGINTSSMDMPKGETPIAFLTPIKYALDVDVRMGDKLVKLGELVKIGGVHLEKVDK